MSQTFFPSIKLDIRTELKHQSFISLHNKKSYPNLPISQDQPISVVCGIANALRFKSTLLQMGYIINDWQQVQDHKPIPRYSSTKRDSSDAKLVPPRPKAVDPPRPSGPVSWSAYLVCRPRGLALPGRATHGKLQPHPPAALWLCCRPT